MERWRIPGRYTAFSDIKLVDFGAKSACLGFLGWPRPDTGCYAVDDNDNKVVGFCEQNDENEH